MSGENLANNARKKPKSVLLSSIEIIVARHHKLATHFVKLVPAHSGSTISGISSGADAEAELVVVLLENVN